MHLPALISDLAVILLTGAVVTVLFKKIKQPLVLGYIVAGFLIGPYMPLFFDVADQVSISTWSEIGIIILMFGLGLEFNLQKLARVGGTGIITALTEVLGMLVLGVCVGQALGWGTMDSIFLGGMLSMSSTTIIIKAFDELGVRQERYAQLVFGTLVIEDIAGIFMMIILSTISVSKSIAGGELALKLCLLVLYLALWLLLGIFLLPTVLKKMSTLMNDETLLIFSLGICFGMVLLADALGFSSALGAFLAGSLLAGTVHAERIEHLTGGVKDLFGAVFFMSVGMMLDPAMVARYILPILILTLTTIVGKLLFSSLGVLFSGQSLPDAVRCGCSLAQIGEFAFIIASLGQSMGVIADYIYPIIISVSVITTLTTPFFIRGADRVYAVLVRILPARVAEKLERYTEDERSQREQDSDWAAFLRRYLRVTALYGVILVGIALVGSRLLLPLLERLPVSAPVQKILCLAVTYLCMALFTAPMLDRRAPQYTALWVKGGSYRLPLIALTALRILLVVLVVFIPLRYVAGAGSLWLLLAIAAALLLLSRAGWLSSAYLHIEARFLANFNERQLAEFSGPEGEVQRLDEMLAVEEFTYRGEEQTLRRLGWGTHFGVNVIKLVHGRRHQNIPAAGTRVADGDRVLVLGERENLHSFRLAMGLDTAVPPRTLREFVQTENDAQHDLYAYAYAVDKGSPLSGSTIRTCGLRENYDCMILGLQRSGLPIVQPDVNMGIQSGDLVWILGSRSMAGKLLGE